MSLDVWLALVALFGIGGLTPGPAVMLVLASSFRYGFRPAMLPALGVASANVFWLILAASGAAVFALQFPKAFLALKIVGVLVILYMALTTIFGPLPDADASASDAPPRRRLYSKGLALQISSPMPLVYFGLLLPAYFSPSQPMAPQFMIMLATVTVTELLGLAAYAYGAGRIRVWMKSPRAARLFNVFIGVVMIASGLWAIISTSGVAANSSI
ncbi:MAG: LysE family translocator [Alphaproteobacteria bacterium]